MGDGKTNYRNKVWGYLCKLWSGEKGLFGYILRVKRTAIADELASAAELVIGQQMKEFQQQ